MSKLDAAYTAAKTDDNKKPDFYNQFLNTDLYIATQPHTEAGDSIAPMLVEYNKIKFLMLFDSQQRLTDWAQKEMNYAVMPGHALVQLMTTDYHWALNVGTEFTKAFVPKEIEWLKTIVEKTKSEQSQNPQHNVSALVRKPKDLPENFTQQLSEMFANNPAVSYAYLGEVRYAIENEPTHLTLVLETRDTLSQNMRDEIEQRAKALLDETVIFDLMLAGESNITNEIIKSLKPFYPKAV